MSGESVEIVKMDATANDVPSPFEVHGYVFNNFIFNS